MMRKMVTVVAGAAYRACAGLNPYPPTMSFRRSLSSAVEGADDGPRDTPPGKLEAGGPFTGKFAAKLADWKAKHMTLEAKHKTLEAKHMTLEAELGRVVAILKLRDWLGALQWRVFDFAVKDLLPPKKDLTHRDQLQDVMNTAGVSSLLAFFKQRRKVKDAWQEEGLKEQTLREVYRRLDNLEEPAIRALASQANDSFYWTAHPKSERYANWEAFWKDASTDGMDESTADLIWKMNCQIDSGHCV
jgi:hypothetical protein